MATTPNTTPTDLEFIGHIINDRLDAQPWGRKVANTLTAFVGAVVSIAAGAMSMGVDLPNWAMLTVIAITTLGTALGVRSTKNGFSDSQVEKLQQWQAEYIDDRHNHGEQDGTSNAAAPEATTSSTEVVGRHRLQIPGLDAAGLSRMVDEFIRSRRG